ncbi:MAG: hypothetical protein ABMA15_30705 [Vicinamibacterales bacterium]
MKLLICLALSFALPTSAYSQTQVKAAPPDVEAAVFSVLDELDDAFTRQDPVAWENTFNFPHYLLTGSELRVFERPGQTTREQMRVNVPPGWDHGGQTKREIVQASPEKVHVLITTSRFRADGSLIDSFDSLFVLTKIAGHWGVKLRSSFAQLR